MVAERPAPDSDARISERPGAASPETISAISCDETLPLTWLTRDDAEQRSRFRRLGSEFELEEATHGAFRAFHLTARRPGACSVRR